MKKLSIWVILFAGICYFRVQPSRFEEELDLIGRKIVPLFDANESFSYYENIFQQLIHSTDNILFDKYYHNLFCSKEFLESITANFKEKKVENFTDLFYHGLNLGDFLGIGLKLLCALNDSEVQAEIPQTFLSFVSLLEDHVNINESSIEAWFKCFKIFIFSKSTKNTCNSTEDLMSLLLQRFQYLLSYMHFEMDNLDLIAQALYYYGKIEGIKGIKIFAGIMQNRFARNKTEYGGENYLEIAKQIGFTPDNSPIDESSAEYQLAEDLVIKMMFSPAKVADESKGATHFTKDNSTFLQQNKNKNMTYLAKKGNFFLYLEL